MRPQRNFLIGLIALLAGIVLTGQALGIWPGGLSDILQRALPAALIALGLGTFLRGRVPFASIIAIALTVFIVINIAVLAFSSRSGQQRDDQTVAVNQPVGTGVTLIAIDVGVLSTDVVVSLDTSAGKIVTGEFVGSRESAFDIDYVDDNSGRAVLTLRETQANAFPRLEDVGRARLTLALPAGVGVDLTIASQQGAATLNLDQANLERLNLNLVRGDAIITLPEYQPQSPSLTAVADALMGTLQVLEGSITVAVPSTVGARFELSIIDPSLAPQFDATVFNYLRLPDAIESRNFDRSTVKLRYELAVPRGQIRINEILR